MCDRFRIGTIRLDGLCRWYPDRPSGRARARPLLLWPPQSESNTPAVEGESRMRPALRGYRSDDEVRLDGPPLPPPRLKLGRCGIRAGQGCFENPQKICEDSFCGRPLPPPASFGEHPHTGRSLTRARPLAGPHSQDAALALDRLKDFWR
jgi:hypothetical protein